jgi:16S rRNA (cytosine967-C5)-methyltransferase
MSSASKVRAEAAGTIARVMSGRNLDEALQQTAGLLPQDMGLLKALVYGVVREHSLLSALASQMLSKPLDKDPEMQALLLVGLYQLRSMRIPPHAAVAETVNATADLSKPWARGLTNALLRRYLRERDTLEAALPPYQAIRYSHPDWMIRAVQRDWPQRWEALLEANQQAGPLTLRVNRRQLSRDSYLEQLKTAGIEAQPVPEVPQAVVLTQAVPVDQIPGFAEGVVTVQDASAQLAAALLDLQDGQRVLDACAAPGGKTTHILELADVEVLAIDSDAQRLPRVQENLDRLHFKATLKAADGTRPSTWWDDRPFDRILLDAPCSGTGVIRRHPDIKWLRRQDDIPQMAAVQLRLLHMLWPLLKPGGLLVYASCSILREEGEDIVSRFLAQQGEAREQVIEAGWGEACAVGRRIAPGGVFDGFYYACLRKSAPAG